MISEQKVFSGERNGLYSPTRDRSLWINSIRSRWNRKPCVRQFTHGQPSDQAVRSGYNFTVLLIGATIQLASGVSLYGLAMAGDGELNHMKLGIKGLVAIIVFVAALVGFLRQRAIRSEKSRLTAGGAAQSCWDRGNQPGSSVGSSPARP